MTSALLDAWESGASSYGDALPMYQTIAVSVAARRYLPRGIRSSGPVVAATGRGSHHASGLNRVPGFVDTSERPS